MKFLQVAFSEPEFGELGIQFIRDAEVHAYKWCANSTTLLRQAAYKC